MQTSEQLPIQLPDADTLRARIDQVDAEARFLRKLLRLVVQREEEQDEFKVTASPCTALARARG